MITLIYDTETTGVPARGEVITSPSYPRLVQLAGVLYEDGHERASFEVIVHPEEELIPAEAAGIHGITTEIAQRVGVPLRLAVALYPNLGRRADELAGHNVGFDAGILAAALHRLGAAVDLGSPRLVCTAELGTPVCRLPPTEKMIAAGRGGQFKRPSLTELHQHLFGESFDGAHGALADARATARCLFELRRRA